MYLMKSAGNRVQVCHDWLKSYFRFDETVARDF